MSEPIAKKFLEALRQTLHVSAVGDVPFYASNLQAFVSLVGRRRSDGGTLLDQAQLRLTSSAAMPVPAPPAAPGAPGTPLYDKVKGLPLAGATDGKTLNDRWANDRQQLSLAEDKLVEKWIPHASDGAALLALLKTAERHCAGAKAGDGSAPVAAPPARGATPADWEQLVLRLRQSTNHRTISALPRLLYIYWHEEAGTYWAIERLADRFENSVHADTQPLRGLHLEERDPSGVGAADLLTTYTSLRRRDLLSPLSERWKQYLMQYGFAPSIARAWPQLGTTDVRRRFAPAFHRWLNEALRYYRGLEDLQRNPDIEPAMAAAEELCRQIAEGGENLGDQPYAEVVRPEVQLARMILGHPQIHRKLGIRPGTASLMASWEQSLDAIADLYLWRRASCEHYRHLAECGETLLLMHALALDLIKQHESSYRALLELLRGEVVRYAISYQTVTGVDLRASADPRTPAEALLTTRPPRVPPLRGQWTDQRASALAAEAASAR
jgi:hypothetical protein